MQTTFRPVRVAVTASVCLISLLAATWLYHPVRVALAHGEWCVQFTPEGTQQILYGGTACGLKP
ncbi:hypothetical protein H6F86_00155 [Phormidium sp. FACHB-592]|uniref:Uncharacterized protein n=1 Tax=Stenomitos frigidus AS-A4 TaxID=2933935 RepID=A0ABV0KTY3_9CYAN|nr:hypothetical protein [Phormidium sp. FACHB-592]MBD2072346.1 hypothetical protein [Phormidium sp. FACHB-592]